MTKKMMMMMMMMMMVKIVNCRPAALPPVKKLTNEQGCLIGSLRPLQGVQGQVGEPLEPVQQRGDFRNFSVFFSQLFDGELSEDFFLLLL